MIPNARPCATDDEARAVAEVLKSGWWTSGPKVAEFEAAFAKACGEGCHAVAVSSATAGLHLALVANSTKGRVAVPTWTFTATAHAVELAGCTPQFHDVNIDTLNMTIRPQDQVTNTCMPVHIAGHRAQDMWCGTIIEDAAHCLPYDPGGNTAVFSFYATKPIACGEGGMVVTRSSNVAAKIRKFRMHGFDRDASDRHATGYVEHQVVCPGFKYNMSDIAAAIGIEQLKRAETMNFDRARLSDRYRTLLRGCMLPPKASMDVHSHHLFIVRVPNRDKFIELMRDKGVACGVHYLPLHRHKYWRDKYELSPLEFPNAEAASRHAVSLPLYAGMTDEQQDHVINAVKEILT